MAECDWHHLRLLSFLETQARSEEVASEVAWDFAPLKEGHYCRDVWLQKTPELIVARTIWISMVELHLFLIAYLLELAAVSVCFHLVNHAWKTFPAAGQPCLRWFQILVEHSWVQSAVRMPHVVHFGRWTQNLVCSPVIRRPHLPSRPRPA